MCAKIIGCFEILREAAIKVAIKQAA